MKNGLKYSDDALMNRVLFLSKENDVNIFVEDIGKEYLYENIFERMFNGNIIINNIFPMNGKPGVEKAYKEYGNKYKGKPSFYIVDGDFDLMLGLDMIESDNYLYLKYYNIEDYYLDEKAVLRFMAGVMKKTQRELLEIIDYSAWESKTTRAFKKLFINYVISRKSNPSEKTIGISPYDYVKENGDVNISKIEEYEENLMEKVENYDCLKTLYTERLEKILDGDCYRLICGKYMIACLYKYLINIVGKGVKYDDLIYSLCCNFNIHKLDYVKSKIENFIANVS